MAIENRFASEEYVLNELQNYEDTHKPNWEENNPESGNYIQNKTHTKEKITLTWDGNYTDTLETYTIYDTNESNLKLIKISDQIPASKESLSVFGVCKIQHNNEIFSSEDNSVKRIVYYMPKIFNHLSSISQNEFTAESIGIVFRSQEDSRADSYFNLLKVLFVLSEGTFEGVTLTPGVYFTDFTYRGLDNFKTVEYSFTAYNKIDDSYLKKGLSNFSYSDNNNTSIHSYSNVEGYNNFVGPLTLSYDILFYEDSETQKKNPMDDVEEIFASHAEGRNNQILTECSHGEGFRNRLRIPYSHIEGYNNIGGDVEEDSTIFSNELGCHIEGVGNRCGGGGEGAHVEGYHTTGSGRGSHAEGDSTVAFTDGTHAQNIKTRAQGIGSTASGLSTIAEGDSSDAGGTNTKAAHRESFTRGYYTETGSRSQAVVGQFNEIFTDSFFDVGNGSSVEDRRTAFSVKKDGSASLQLQGITDDSITRKDYVDTLVANSKENTIKELLNITNAIDSWESVQKIVRAGYAPLIFNIGDQLTCNSEQFGELTWDIIGFDQDTPTDSQYTHSLTLQLHDIVPTTYKEFDNRDAMYITQTDLEGPNTYYLSYPTNLIKNDGSIRYFSITLPEGAYVPTGSILYCAENNTNGMNIGFIPDRYLYSIDDMFCQVNHQTGITTLPENAIVLGECAYATGYGVNLGNGNYGQSAIRVYLNSEATALEWEPFYELDMPPSYMSESGFLYGMDPEFMAALGEVDKICYDVQNKVTYTVSDKIFLPSNTEVFGKSLTDSEGNLYDLGTPYAYYQNNSTLTEPANATADANRIKYDQNKVAAKYFLRNVPIPNKAQATQRSIVAKTGSVTGAGVINAAVPYTKSGGIFLAPCCCIV